MIQGLDVSDAEAGIIDLDDSATSRVGVEHLDCMPEGLGAGRKLPIDHRLPSRSASTYGEDLSGGVEVEMFDWEDIMFQQSLYKAPALDMTKVEQRGARIKKRIEVDLVEAETVRLIFRLALEGHDGSGPMGVKAIAVWLNGNGHRTRAGATWGIGPLHALLTNTVYAGTARFNRTDSRMRTRKSETEHVTAPSPIIIDPPVFERVQTMLKSRNPRINPPRVVAGPILLTGLAYCASCAGAMTLRTGTSNTGKVHRYYSCSTCARHGKSVCKGRSIPMDKLDGLVTSHLLDRLLAPERLTTLLEALAVRRAERSVAVDARITALQANAVEAEERLRRIYKMVEDGVAEMDDILKDRITALKAEREITRAAVERASGANRPPIVIEPARIAAFGTAMRERLTSGEIPYRKAHLGALIDRVEVDDHQIRIRGRKDVLEQAVLASGGPIPGVRSFVRRWRTGQDSNPRPPDS
jgi:site-specific DNA recombinase